MSFTVSKRHNERGKVMNEEKQIFAWVKELTESGRILIGGCSGSGKSVALKDIIYTLMACSPNTHQFVFVDLKRVELKVFKKAPHTVAYVTEPEDVMKALNVVLQIIDDRYKRMERNDELKSSEPYLWVVIDEFADLSCIGNKSINTAIQRISQIGRAARVNLICATQRPTSSDGILKGAIACNLDSRLALRTVNKQDSRNIIGCTGAEELPDYGYGIMQVKGRNKKIQIPFLEMEELKARVNAWHDTPRVYQNPEVPTYAATRKQSPNVRVYSTDIYGNRRELKY